MGLEMSFIWRVNNRGPSTAPCGTPQVLTIKLLVRVFSVCSLLIRWFSISFKTYLLILILDFFQLEYAIRDSFFGIINTSITLLILSVRKRVLYAVNLCKILTCFTQISHYWRQVTHSTPTKKNHLKYYCNANSPCINDAPLLTVTSQNSALHCKLVSRTHIALLVP